MVAMPCQHCSNLNGCAVRTDSQGHARCLYCDRDLGDVRPLPRAADAPYVSGLSATPSLTAWQREVQEQLEGKAIAHMAAARMRGYRVPLDIFRRDLAKRFNAEDLAEFKRLAVAFWPARERS